MKKLLVFILVATAAFKAGAQEHGIQVQMDMVPRNIEILPGVYEFFGKVMSLDEKGKLVYSSDSYAITIEQDLADEIIKDAKAEKMIYLYGPQLEDLAQKMCINRYEKKRKDLEDTLTVRLAEAKTALKNVKAFHSRKTAKQAVKNAEELLIKEQANSIEYIAQLRDIVKRKNTTCMYIYNYKAVGESDGKKKNFKSLF